MEKRIIDGAELFTQACKTHDEFIGLDELAELLDKMPTIEAITIGWLDTYCTDCAIGLRDNDDIAIKTLLEDWRIEMSRNDELFPNCVSYAKMLKVIEDQLKERKMRNRIIDRQTWHEVITDEMDWVLVDMGAWKLVDDCVDPYDPDPCETYKTNYNEYCHAIIRSEHFPDELSFNQVKAILNNYLSNRWEEYKKNG